MHEERHPRVTRDITSIQSLPRKPLQDADGHRRHSSLEEEDEKSHREVHGGDDLRNVAVEMANQVLGKGGEDTWEGRDSAGPLQLQLARTNAEHL